MNYEIVNHNGTTKEYTEIMSLLNRVYVEGGYTDKLIAERMFAPDELRKRGEIILARSTKGQLLGMVIFVLPTSPARQVAEADEAEIHLLAVSPEARRQGIASSLIKACEKRAILVGYSKMVLSTQQSMKDAHNVYKRLGYRQNVVRTWSKKDANKIFHVYEKSLGN
jgi:ribosomal protein S18 acetylase RimI-like enzyme